MLSTAFVGNVGSLARGAMRIGVDFCRGYGELDSGEYRAPRFIPDYSVAGSSMRLNVVLPTIEKSQIFGGIATALRLFELLLKALQCQGRIIITKPITADMRKQYPEYHFIEAGVQQSGAGIGVVSIHEKRGAEAELAVGRNDFFICTWWKTFYRMYPVQRFQHECFGTRHSVVYMIQDYEPGFYPWSSEYLLCESTYRHDDITALVNSDELMRFLAAEGYQFEDAICFRPSLNPALRANLLQDPRLIKERTCIIYGRPRVKRNCFELICGALKMAVRNCPDLAGWNFVSVGHKHSAIKLAPGVTLSSIGKLTLDEYASLLRRASVGVSLMCSPHPSYPPLEMASFGVKTVTNSYATKDLTAFSANMKSLDVVTFENLADAVISACGEYREVVDACVDDAYIRDDASLKSAAEALLKIWSSKCAIRQE